MGKKHKKKHHNGGGGPQVGAPPAVSATTTASLPLGQLEEAAQAAGIITQPAASVPTGADGATPATGGLVAELRSRLDTLIEGYTRAREALDARELGLLQAEEDLKKLQGQCASAAEAVEADREALEAARAELAAAQVASRERTEALLEREEGLRGREADADAGFVRRREALLAELQRAHDGLLEQNRALYEEAARREQAHVKSLARLQEEHTARLEAQRVEVEASLATRAAELQQAEEEARARARALQREAFDAAEAAKDAADLRAHVEEYIEERASERVAESRRQVEAAHRASEALRSRVDALELLVAQREAAVRLLDNMSPEAVKARLDALAAQVQSLEAELADRPSRPEADELAGLRAARAGWEQERTALVAEKERIATRLERLLIEVDSNEILRDRNRALQENQRLLKAAIDDLSQEIDERLDRRQDQATFPEMTRMDGDEELRRAPHLLFPGEEGIDLEDFAEGLRDRIGLDPDGKRPNLYYRKEDLRAFLGGMAMSRLHLVQGISGIGKSSLPRAFAAAVGGLCETVSVQAGWRDRNDLFGYFNAFERRYYELPFTQALYKAATHQWADRVVVVLLDEMNLSHPEQYAADLLDVLERPAGPERRFELLPFNPPGRPPALLRDGRYLPLPPNVWFVGTANHDETTRDFADKTYDRSFVLELPGRPKPFSPSSPSRRAPVSSLALLEAFDAAEKAYARDGEAALRWMDQNLRGPAEERFRIGWGGRLEAQARRFIPVVRAAGGKLGEALDQLITTRVLRKIRGRHDNLEEDLKQLDEVLEVTWPDPTHPPVAARQLLADALRHLQG